MTAEKLPARDGFHNPFTSPKGFDMSESVYKLIELTGSSKKNLEDAIQNAIKKASKSLHKLHWFQVTETRGTIEKGAVAHWQVTLKVGFTLD